MPNGTRYYNGPVSDHFDGVRFFNPGHPTTDRSLREMLRWKFGEKPARWPKSIPGHQVIPEACVEGLRVTMVGHATLLIQAPGLNVLTDPLWSHRASPVTFVGPSRMTQPGIEFTNLPKIDVVLLSHNHYDHFDVSTLQHLHNDHRPLIVTPLGNDTILRHAIPDAQVVTGDWGDRIALGGGADVHIVPAYHWSARGMGDRRMALWGGFMLKTQGKLLYFSGDTGYGDGAIFRSMRERFGPTDIALLPIGGYAPQWFMASQHINPVEAVRIMIDLDARQAIGIHWGDFQLTNEDREAPPTLLRRALHERAIEQSRFPAASAGDIFNFPITDGLQDSTPYFQAG